MIAPDDRRPCHDGSRTCPASTSSPRSTCKRSATRSTRRAASSRPASTSRAPTASVELSDNEIELDVVDRGPAEGRSTQVLEEKLVRRKVSLKALDYGKVEEASKGTRPPDRHAQRRHLDEKAREIDKFIKGLGLKGVQHQIQGDQLRVTRQEARRPAGGDRELQGARLRRSRCSSRTSATDRRFCASDPDRPPRRLARTSERGQNSRRTAFRPAQCWPCLWRRSEAGDAVVGRRVGA